MTVAIEGLSAITLATGDMARAVRFYRQLGFVLRYGGESASFSSFAAGEAAYLNLIAIEAPSPERPFWGRVIFHVADVDAIYQRALKLGLEPEAAPRDASWGERFFHLRDPDGHELSFARPLSSPGVPSS
jgi:catechol 2,3-dioxygenase-like lactoylglutathione lyase family enzyme